MPYAIDHTALGELHREIHDSLRGYLIRAGASEAEADDLVAEAFVIAIKKWATRHPGKEKRWVYGIARKKLLEHRKERGRFRESVATGVFALDPPASVHEQFEAAVQYSKLSPAEQEVVHFIYIEKFSPEEVAELRGSTVSAVYELLRSARARIAKGALDVA